VVLEQTAMEIAAATQTSDATVVRAIQALGTKSILELTSLESAVTVERIFSAEVTEVPNQRSMVLEQTAMEIAAATQTSDATVVRAIQALGFAGLRDKPVDGLPAQNQYWN
jgi:DNA-binding MurR/RpiR family transcriptional regulator